MKKLLIIFLLCSSTFVFAQDLVTKKGVKILPEAKSFAFGLDATPILNFAGNMFNGDNNNYFRLGMLRGLSINMKYLKSENMAIRMAINPMLHSVKDEELVVDDLILPGDPYNNAKVSDLTISKNHGLMVYGGIEKRKSKGRMIGYVGADLGLGFANDSREYSYGNEFSVTNPYPTSTYHGKNYDGYRVTSYNDGLAFISSLRPFVGLEFFICPNISLSAEYGILAELSMKKQGKATSELWAPFTQQVREQTTAIGEELDFDIQGDNLNGAVGLYIYFN